MSKAILVLPEMPENCKRCTLADFEITCFPTEHEIANADIRPDWCPLRLLPEKQNICGTYPRKDEKTPSYFIGWNDAIEAIEGSRE